MKPLLLVTGAAGRVGRLLRPVLAERYALRLLDLADPGASAQEEAILGDLADPAMARRAVAGAAGVLHLAGLVGPDFGFEATLRPNYLGLVTLLEACRAARCPRFVFASSHHVVGLHAAADAPFDAAAPLAPDGFYGLSKAFGEAACSLYARRFAMPTLIIRIGNADPEVADARRARMWVSARDLAALVDIGMTAQGLACETVYGVSRASDPLFADAAAARLGYRPRDDSRDHHAAGFRPSAALGPADGADRVGGFFATRPLPHPGEP